MFQARPGTSKDPPGYPEILKGNDNSRHGDVVKKNEQYRTGNQKEKQSFVAFKISANCAVHPIPLAFAGSDPVMRNGLVFRDFLFVPVRKNVRLFAELLAKLG
jgi:hypothetical protein